MNSKKVIFHSLENVDNTNEEIIDEPNKALIKKNNQDYFPKKKLFYIVIILIIAVILALTLILCLEEKTKKPKKPLISIQKPLIDIRSYYSYTLGNGMQTILILDPACINPGAALSINAGSKQEGQIHGLAHLLEHALFIGNEKYPKEAYFYNKISLLNGFNDSYTSYEVTVHYWSIAKIDEFDEVLNIWADYFVHPLFVDNEIMSKINVVNAEYVTSLADPGWRRYFLEKLMMNPLSVKSKFDEGSLASLTPNNMNITVEL